MGGTSDRENNNERTTGGGVEADARLRGAAEAATVP